jgi:hypothetical protein
MLRSGVLLEGVGDSLFLISDGGFGQSFEVLLRACSVDALTL